MATREQLIEDFADHKYATGEKFARLINSMKVVQEPVTDPQASGTSHSFIDSISQSADGKITATKKSVVLNYVQIQDKPTINGVTLMGDQTAAQLGLATANQVEVVSNKVDKLPSGYYYGKFNSVEDLPEATEKGYAYVASSDPTVFYTYLVSGAGAEWVDSGNKMVNTIDITTPKIAGTELTKGEKYYASANVNDRPADVVAETGVVKSLGYRVLNPAMSFAEQVESTQTVDNSNMIFEIKDSFDLGGGSVTIPANCTLRFNGGRLINGTISSNHIIIDNTNDSRIFSGIEFSGQCKYTDTVKLAWWISKFPQNVQDTSVDNTAEFQDCVDSGMMNIEIPDNFIRLTNTIEVNRCISFLFNSKYRRQQLSPASTEANKQLWSKFIRPCIFSTNVITLIRYNIESDAYNPVRPFTLGKFLMYINIPYTEVDETSRNTPILDIKTSENSSLSIYGVSIDCDIMSECRKGVLSDYVYRADDPRVTSSQIGTRARGGFLNYTAINLQTIGAAMTYIRINGFLNGTCYGVQAVGAIGTTHWMTDLSIYGDTVCCYGAKLIDVNPLYIYGSHQAQTLDHVQHNSDKSEAYFTCNTNIYLHGFVWDCFKEDNGLNNVRLPLITNAVDKSTIGLGAEITQVASRYRIYNDGSPISTYYLYRYENDNFYKSNFLRRALYPKLSITINPFKTFSYTFDGVDIFDTNLYNSDCLFNEYLWKQENAGNLQNKWMSYVLPSENKAHILKIEASFDYISIFGTSGSRTPLTFIYNFSNANLIYYKVRFYTKRGEQEVEIHNTEVGNKYNGTNKTVLTSFYYGDSYRQIIIDAYRHNLAASELMYIDIEIQTNPFASYFALPTLIIPYNGVDGACAGETKHLPKFKDNTSWGTQYFDTDKNTLNIWNGKSYGVVDVLPASNKKGGIDNRPVNPQIGCCYIDTSLSTNGTPIFWNGSFWTDAEGVFIEDVQSGGLTERLAISSPVKNMQFKQVNDNDTYYLLYNGLGWIDTNAGTFMIDDTGELSSLRTTYYDNNYIGVQLYTTDDDPILNNKYIKLRLDGTSKYWCYLNNNTIITVPTPVITFNSEGGVVTAMIDCKSTVANIKYTLNGSNPTASSTAYTRDSEITLQEGDQLKAAAWYTFNGIYRSNDAYIKVATPSISIENGILTIICSTSDAEIYYTTNGDTPTTASEHYTGEVSGITTGTTVKAIATLIGRVNSGIVTETY